MSFIWMLNVHIDEFSSISPFSHSFFSIPSYSHVMAHLLEWCLRFDKYIWCPSLGIWCMDLYSYVHIICNSKYNKSMCERLAFPCSWITSFHGFGFRIEVVLYQICMRNFIWVWWCWWSHILFITLYFHSNILFISKSKKLLCEKLSFSCHCSLAFMDFGFNVEVVLYQICMRYTLLFLWYFYIHIWLFNL